jgi:hypothetical protein
MPSDAVETLRRQYGTSVSPLGLLVREVLAEAKQQREFKHRANVKIEKALEKLREAIRVCRSDSARAAMRDVYATLGGDDAE